jgi:hypothetical protein
MSQYRAAALLVTERSHYAFHHPGIALTSTMAAVINGNAMVNRMRAVPNDGASAAEADG